MRNNTYILGVAGGSGSGKTFFAQRLIEYFSKKKLVVFLHGDRRDKSDYKIKEQGNFTKAIKEEKDNINFFY